jgi:hypothetical protein
VGSVVGRGRDEAERVPRASAGSGPLARGEREFRGTRLDTLGVETTLGEVARSFGLEQQYRRAPCSIIRIEDKWGGEHSFSLWRDTCLWELFVGRCSFAVIQ